MKSIWSDLKAQPFGMFNMEDVCNENRIICHPHDYERFAESGVVEAFTKGGIKVIQSHLVDEGKPIATGELACAVTKKWRIKKS